MFPIYLGINALQSISSTQQSLSIRSIINLSLILAERLTYIVLSLNMERRIFVQAWDVESGRQATNRAGDKTPESVKFLVNP